MSAVVLAARGWLGTPYRHQASVKGVGADCLGLVRGVWREVIGEEPQAVPAYTPDWAEVGSEETLLKAAGRLLMPVVGDWRAGNVLVFRMSPGVQAKHCAILSDLTGPERRMIHAYWGRAVVESWMGTWWRSRVVGAFRFPQAEGSRVKVRGSREERTALRSSLFGSISAPLDPDPSNLVPEEGRWRR